MTVTALPAARTAEDPRTPPQDLQAEACVLGSMLMSAPAAADVFDGDLQGRDFYRPRHEVIFDAMAKLHADGHPVDATTVAASLQAAGELGQIGGPATIHELMAATPTPANVTWYARIVADRAALRRVIAAGTRVVQLGFEGVGRDAAEVIDQAQAATTALTAGHHDPLGEVDMSAALDEVLDQMETGAGPALPTGLKELDRALTGGLRAGTLTTIGARPSIGKTALGLSLALHAAVHQGTPVGFTSLEMLRGELLVRATACLGGLDYSRLLSAQSGTAKLTESEWRAVSAATGKIRGSRLRVHDRTGVRVSAIRSGIRAMIRREGSCGLWVVDYLGLIEPEDRKASREQQVSAISRGLKLTALELGVPIVALHQLNRESERGQREPRMSDLRDSGAIEQDSDVVILLHRDLQDEVAKNVLGVNVAKNRRGPTMPLVMDFHGAHQRVTDQQWTPHAAIGGR